jgi:hypothetical protein
MRFYLIPGGRILPVAGQKDNSRPKGTGIVAAPRHRILPTKKKRTAKPSVSFHPQGGIVSVPIFFILPAVS